MDPELIFILIFILAPLIERLLNAGKKKKTPQPPQQRLPESYRDEEERPRVLVARREEQSAAEMLPDDLWEILTGERRAPRAPVPAPPEPVEEEELWSLEADSSEDDWSAASLPETEVLPAPVPSPELPVPRARFERPLPARAAPETVSLEALDIDGRRRHEQFHERLDRSRAQKVARAGAAPKPSFHSASEARRAIILSEILGPPKGLQ